MLFVDLVGRHMTVETTYKTFAVYSQKIFQKIILNYPKRLHPVYDNDNVLV